MTLMHMARCGPSLSFRISHNSGRLAVIRRTLEVAQAQGDLFTTELIERTLRRITKTAVLLPEIHSTLN